MTARAALFGLNFRGPSTRVSVIAPVHNEADNVAPLIAEIADALQGIDAEIIFIDDASADETRAALTAQKAVFPQLRVLVHQTQAGQSRAVRTGVLAARGEVICTIDGDGQNDPIDIPRLLDQLTRANAPDQLAMVAGQRRSRKDSPAKRMGSAVANGVRRRILDDGAADTACGLKAFYREAYLRVAYFDHVHRYLPAMFQREGFEVEYLDVAHRPRRHGTSNYTNWRRLAVAFRDIFGVDVAAGSVSFARRDFRGVMRPL